MYFWINFVYVVSVAVVFYGFYKSIQQNLKFQIVGWGRKKKFVKLNYHSCVFFFVIGIKKPRENSISQNSKKLLCDIVILIRVILVSFHIITINKGFDSFFQIWRFYWKSQLVIQFTK